MNPGQPLQKQNKKESEHSILERCKTCGMALFIVNHSKEYCDRCIPEKKHVKT